MMNNVSISNNKNIGFTGRVDKSVVKYVKRVNKETKELYILECLDKKQGANPRANEYIDKRCADVLKNLKQIAESLHKDTVIKVKKDPYKYKKNNGLYLCVENKNLLQAWEQSGATNRYSVYENDLREMNNSFRFSYDDYINRLEWLVNNLNPKTIDKTMVQNSISNHWHINVNKLKGKSTPKSAKSTQKMADEIGYNTTFLCSYENHLTDVRMTQNLLKNKQTTKHNVFQTIKDFFMEKNK